MLLACVLSLFAVLSGTLASGHHGTQASDESYQQLVPELLLRMTTLERKLDESKATEEILLQEIEKLKSENVAQQNQIRELQTLVEAENTAEEADDIQPSADVTGTPSEQQNVLTEFGAPVSFSAYIDHDGTSLSIGQKIVCNKVLHNDGNAYNDYEGTFTTPVDGVYLFSFFVGSRHVMQIFGNLVVNGNLVSTAVAEGIKDAQDLQGGNVVILRLTRGDVVALEVAVGNHVEGGTTKRITTFSGTLLYN